MNLEEKRQEVSARVLSGDEAKLNAILQLLDSAHRFLVEEDDSTIRNYGNKSLRYRLITMVQAIDEPKLDAMLELLPPVSYFGLSEEDLAIIEERRRRYEAGETTMVDAREAGVRILESIRKKRKSSTSSSSNPMLNENFMRLQNTWKHNDPD